MNIPLSNARKSSYLTSVLDKCEEGRMGYTIDRENGQTLLGSIVYYLSRYAMVVSAVG